MKRLFFVRNVRAGDQLELFLVAAVSSVLLVRLYLFIFDYPQIGGGGLHIAHMLWGGFLMLFAMVLLFAFIGYRVQRVAALVGGTGFGVFIDELGKFITRDNDYFYQPTIALIYATFVVLFLLFRFLARTLQLSSKEYLLNALVQLEDIALDDFEESEKKQVIDLLGKADTNEQFTKQLQLLVATANVKSDPPKRFRIIYRFNERVDKTYGDLLRKRYTNRLVKAFFIVEALIFLSSIVLLIANSINDVFIGSKGMVLDLETAVVGEAISAGVAGLLVLLGLYRFSHSRIKAYELFRQATTVQIYLTSFFIFYRDEFGALPVVLFNIALFFLLRAAISAEIRLTRKDGK